MNPRPYKGITWYIKPCVIMASFIPIITLGALRKPMELIPIPKTTVDSYSAVSILPTRMLLWNEDPDPQVIEFDVEVSDDMFDWITTDRTTNHWSIVPANTMQKYYRVGTHYK